MSTPCFQWPFQWSHWFQRNWFQRKSQGALPKAGFVMVTSPRYQGDCWSKKEELFPGSLSTLGSQSHLLSLITPRFPLPQPICPKTEQSNLYQISERTRPLPSPWPSPYLAVPPPSLNCCNSLPPIWSVRFQTRPSSNTFSLKSLDKLDHTSLLTPGGLQFLSI